MFSCDGWSTTQGPFMSLLQNQKQSKYNGLVSLIKPVLYLSLSLWQVTQSQFGGDIWKLSFIDKIMCVKSMAIDNWRTTC